MEGIKRARTDELMAAAVASGNVSVPGAMESELLELSASTRQMQEQHAVALRELEVKQRQRAMVVPAKDEEVKLALRSLGEPICLFGERPLDRRERLKRLLAQKQVDAEIFGTAPGGLGLATSSSSASAGAIEPQEKRTKAFFTEASPAVVAARQSIADNSWRRAQARLTKEWMTPIVLSSSSTSSSSAARPKGPRLEMIASLNELRPVASCSFSTSAKYVLTGSFDESCRVYRTDGDYACISTLRGHTQRICHAEFRSVAAEDEVPMVASGSAEGQVRLWKGDATVATLDGHIQRVGRLAWEPTGRFVCSTSFDRTWRLWDAEASACLLTQDGHAREVYACDFHPDGALLCTADMGAACLVWDLRAGKVTHTFTGHVLGVLSASFSPNGYHLATGGLDNQVRVWDLRKKECHQVLPAHSRPVTVCKFSRHDGGSSLITASHDKSIRIWNSKEWKKIGALVAHEGPVLAMDISSQTGRIVTGGYDRAIKFIETGL